MASNYPTSLDTATQQPAPGATTDLDASGYEHHLVHTNHSDAIIELETKVGIGSANAASASANTVLTHTGSGTTAWNAPATPTAITVADTTDTSCSVALFESATGDLAPKSDGGLTYNAGTGTLTATALTAGSVVAPLAINAQTGTTYTFVAADAGKLVTASNGSAQTYTVPPNSSVAFDVGTAITIIGIGSGKVTLAQGSGVTINSKDGDKAIDGQHASVTVIKTATDTWQLIGALQA